MKYIILTSDTSVALSQHVNEFIKKGWKPCGGACITKNQFYQAMTKNKKK